MLAPADITGWSRHRIVAQARRARCKLRGLAKLVRPSGRVRRPLSLAIADLATGRAIFGIPFIVPPGRQGVAPQLSLNYSSSSKNGPIGMGWVLELGSVERSTRNGAPQFDTTDVYVLKFGGVSADLVPHTFHGLLCDNHRGKPD